MSDDLVVGRINFLTNEPLQVSLGGTPFNKAHLDARAAEIKRLETALTEARAEIERLRGDVSAYASENTNLRNDLVQRGMAEESLRARVREVVEPFAEIAGNEAFQFQTREWRDLVLAKPTGARLAFVQADSFRAARQLMEEVK